VMSKRLLVFALPLLILFVLPTASQADAAVVQDSCDVFEEGGSTFVRIYFTIVIIYGLLALLVAVPLGALGANALSRFLIGAFNAETAPFTVVPQAVLVQIVLALLAPLLAALVPILSGSRITVRPSGSALPDSTWGALTPTSRR